MRLSVIICTYNHAHFLVHALDSLAAQTHRDFELVIVDDGSTDDTAALVRAMAPRFADCRYVTKEHSGLADSRNAGVRAASGDYLGFLDADDLWAPEYLARVAEALARRPQIELVACNGFHVSEAGELLAPLFPSTERPVCGPLATLEELFAFFPYVAGGSAMFFARSVYDRVGPFRGFPTAAEDWGWIIRAVRAGSFCYRVDEPLVVYRRRAASLTGRADEMLRGWLAIFGESFGGDGRDARALGWALTWPRIPGLLAHHPAATNRALLRETMRLFGHRALLEPITLFTYVGLCRAAQLVARGRRLVRGRPRTARVDLDDAPERLFASLRRIDAKANATDGRSRADCA